MKTLLLCTETQTTNKTQQSELVKQKIRKERQPEFNVKVVTRNSKKFNKKDTFDKHMKIVHKKPGRNETENEIGRSKESNSNTVAHNCNLIEENEVSLRATGTRKKESQNFLIIDKV